MKIPSENHHVQRRRLHGACRDASATAGRNPSAGRPPAPGPSHRDALNSRRDDAASFGQEKRGEIHGETRGFQEIHGENDDKNLD